MSTARFFTMPDWLRDFFSDSFRKYLVVCLVAVGIAVFFGERSHLRQTASGSGKQILFFFNPQCPHCRQQKEFNAYLQEKYPEVSWKSYDTMVPENLELLVGMAAKSGKSAKTVAVPTTVIGPYLIIGFQSPETTGVRLEKALLAYVNNDPSLYPEAGRGGKETVRLPLLGEIRPAEYSLFALAVIIGLVDGFNPCAMWVLVYLISLIVSLNDRKKMWFLVGTFVLSSGVLYFLFMTAWLNAFLFLGYLRSLTLLIGLFALGAGILNIREYIQTKGNPTCAIGDSETKKENISRIERIVGSPLTVFSLCSIIALAFIVNSIEFACSAALPAIFTHTLALKHLPALQYYGYILVYDFFFMLDDMIIFSLAVLALETTIGNRYAGHCRIIGGIVLVVLGCLMVFFPQVLR